MATIPQYVVASLPEGTEPSWRDFAACKDFNPEMFFPKRGASTREARAICDDCPVKDLCLEYALETRQIAGIWGGCSNRDRASILRQRRRDAQAGVNEETAS